MSQKTIRVVGYPKSGNTWLARLLGDALDSPVISGKNKPSLADEGFDRKGKYVIRQDHMMRREPDNNDLIVFIVRDPRDVAVSVMYYWQRKNLMDVIQGMAGFSKGENFAPLKKSGGWIAYINRWVFENNYADQILFYEDLLNETVEYLDEILYALGAKPVNDLFEVVERQSFAKRKQTIHKHLPYGDEIQHRLMRKGVAGDWKNHFKRQHAEFFHEYFYETMRSLSYENDPDWWQKCAS